MNEPIGRFGSCSPARARRTAVATAAHRLLLADDALGQLVLHVEQLVALAFEHLVDRDAGPARDDLRDVVGRHRLLDQRRAAPSVALRRRELLLELGDDAVGQLARALIFAAPLRLLELVARCVELLLELLRRRRACPSPPSSARSARPISPRARRAPSRASASRSLEAVIGLLLQRLRSILSCMMRRSSSSSSSGLESTCMRRRDAASSTRSIALSGRKRSVM